MMRSGSPLPAVELFGIPLAITTYEELANLVYRSLDAKEQLVVDCANTQGLGRSCFDQRLRVSLMANDVVLPDGMPLVWCMNQKGAGMRDRLYGPYVVERVLENLPRRTRVALIGGFPDMHERLQSVSPQRFPNADYVLLYDAPLGTIDRSYVTDCLTRIEDTDAELVFILLGLPRQVYWAAMARAQLGARVSLSVGSAFDFVVGQWKYAPHWMQRAGLTWVHRWSQDPWNMGKRYAVSNPTFLWYLLTREILTGKLWERDAIRPPSRPSVVLSDATGRQGESA